MNYDLNKAIENVESFLQSEAGNRLINTGAGVIEKQGDTNYIRAVLTAEALGRITNTTPVIDELGNGRYQIAWYDDELTAAREYFERVAVDAVTASGEPSPVVVDWYPVISPLATKYALPTIAGISAALFGVGWLIGKAK